MSKSGWVNKKKDLAQSDTAIKKEKTPEEKRSLVKKQVPDRKQNTVQAGKTETQGMRQSVAKLAKKKAANVIKATGSAAKAGTIGLTEAAGKVMTDVEADAGGHPDGNMLGVLANQANRNNIISKKNAVRKKNIEKKKQDAEKKTAGTKVKNTAKKIGEKGVSATKASMVGMTAAAGQMVKSAENGVEGSPESNAFTIMAEQTNQTRQMMSTLGKVPDSFKKSVLGKQQKGISQGEQAKRCGVKNVSRSNEVQVKQNPDTVKQYVATPEIKEKKVCSKEEREKSKKRKKKEKKNKKEKKPGKLNKALRIANVLTSFFNGDMADNILNVLKAGAPFLILLDVVFTALLTVLLTISGFITAASEAARHPISFFLEDSEEETSSEDYLRTAVRKKEEEFDKEIADFLSEDTEYNEVIYDRGLQNDWSIWEDSICVAYLARIFVETKESTEADDATYPLLTVDTDKEKEVLDEIFHLLHFTEIVETEVEVPDGTETVENTYYMTMGSNLQGMNVEDHVCGFSHRDEYENWDNHYIPCLVSEESGFELGTVLQAASTNQTAGLKYQIVGFNNNLDNYTISVCQNLKCNSKIYPCAKDFTILSGKKTIQEEVEQTVYKTVTKKTMTVYHYSLTEWQSKGIRGNFPSDEESGVVDEMNSLLE